ncbi:MAG: hypothetical protein KKB51_11955 [Candidatus Riflebacteria bacterium]|nr:hypothetical protein [Candidatus Riflebacteria bacterium]
MLPQEQQKLDKLYLDMVKALKRQGLFFFSVKQRSFLPQHCPSSFLFCYAAFHPMKGQQRTKFVAAIPLSRSE